MCRELLNENVKFLKIYTLVDPRRISYRTRVVVPNPHTFRGLIIAACIAKVQAWCHYCMHKLFNTQTYVQKNSIQFTRFPSISTCYLNSNMSTSAQPSSAASAGSVGQKVRVLLVNCWKQPVLEPINTALQKLTDVCVCVTMRLSIRCRPTWRACPRRGCTPGSTS